MGSRGVVGVEVAGPGNAASLVLGGSLGRCRFRLGTGLALGHICSVNGWLCWHLRAGRGI